MVWLVATLTMGCAAEPTQLLVSLCTDYSPGEIGSIRVAAVDADDPSALEVTRAWEGSELADGGLSFGIEGEEGRRVRLVARLFGPTGTRLVERVVETGFVAGVTLPVTLRLSSVCEGARCEGTCGDDGLCEPVSVPVESWAERAGVCEGGGPVVNCDVDGDGARSGACGGDDCDDDDARRFPGNVELCDAVDQDCDPCTVGVRDADMDGATSAACSNAGADSSCEGVVVQDGVARGPDCDDTRADARPGAEERCDGSDDDCDGFVDEGFETTSFWIDADGDGHGDASAEPVARCVEPDGYADTNDDCDDTTASRHPGAAEACNEVDDDCDERVDEIEGNVFYRDVDGDGFGVEGDTLAVASCDAPEGYAPVAGDCRPDDAAAFPGAEERCNRLDDDCSAPSPGGVEEREDRDDDGHAPLGATCVGGFEADDCDDTNAFANPSRRERCDGGDDDCDGDVDEGTDVQCASGVCEAGCHERRGVAVGVTAACRGGASFACWGTMQGVLETPAPAPVTMASETVRQVAMTGHHACALLIDGTVRCVGANAFGQLGDGTTTVPDAPVQPAITDVVQVATGWVHSCALRRDGTVWCWGVNEFGELGTGDRELHRTPTRLPSLDGVVELEAAGYTTCARRFEGDVWCWGYSGVGGANVNAELPVLVLRDASKLSLGGEPAPSLPYPVVGCAEVAGTWQCWGDFAGGARGTAMDTPSPLLPMSVARDVAPAYFHSCGLRDDGTLRCWGRETDGYLGTNVGTTSVNEAEVSFVTDAEAVSCGRAHCCVERVGGGIRCFGRSNEPLGDGLRRDGSAAEPVARLRAVDGFAVGMTHACAIESGALFCWGSSSSGALGVGDLLLRYEPEPLGLSAVEVDTHRQRTCARNVAGEVWCWSQGRAGDVAGTSSARVPTAVDASAMGAVTTIAVGERFTCALDTSGAAWCWGDASASVCGGVDCTTPHAVGGPSFDELGAGQSHVCGRAGGRVWCWGRGGSGRLGQGATTDLDAPTEVAGLTDVVQLGVGYHSTCVRRATGEVVCFGEGSAGELGAGDGMDHTTPVAVSGLSDATDLVCDRGCFARRAVGGWVAWGEGSADRLGLGATTDVLAPVPAAHGVDFEALATGADSACGRVADGTLRCWGGTGASSASRMLGLPIFGDVE
ncbi:MAG: hypothetical protein H6722_13910 [Sandaracinus sp.]|nr:hypothetical protein [Sandaracinus sp.]MCB9613538.1 hypothetical protein [Sandaracinus sp.]MCB9619698.1 hypothetical protein [Sandaracinus sp.]